MRSHITITVPVSPRAIYRALTFRRWRRRNFEPPLKPWERQFIALFDHIISVGVPSIEGQSERLEDRINRARLLVQVVSKIELPE